MLSRAAAMVMAFIIAAALLTAPAYGDPQRSSERVVHAYNCHNLYYDP